ncbi:MAG: hypothetical protein DHS20C18_17810 [Saprospiraceae bacterium]|nr:MAG: hypothetical protein DHS20C18_17810 [Saprospiraceae bacterium]
MIETVKIENFKSYQNAELKLANLTVLIGANASGKSNALEAIRFLNWIAQGQKLSSLQYMVNDNDKVVRGKIEDLPSTGQKSFTLGCSINKLDFRHLEISLEVRKGDLHIGYEGVHQILENNEKYYLYQTKGKSEGERTGINIEYNNFARGGKKPQIGGTDQMGVFLQLLNSARFADGHKKTQRLIPKAASDFEQDLLNILFLDPVPQKMRDYSFESERKIFGDGSNLSSVLYYLWNTDAGKEKNRKTILQFISSLPEQNITEITFIRGPRKEVMLQLKETFGGKEQEYDASLLSDGTLRVLAYAAVLLSAPKGSMVIMEEIDNGVHPSRAHQLLASMNKVARERELTILLSTHNPAMLDALPNEAVPKVVFCYRDPESGYSQLVRMEDLPNYPELIAQGSLGDLLTRGLVDRFVKQQEDESEKKQKALKWLEAIK